MWTRFWFQYKLERTTIIAFVSAFYFIFIHLVSIWNVPFDAHAGHELMASIFVIMCLCSLRIAFRCAAYVEQIMITFLYAFTYLISQVDDYQHHYLLLLMLIVLSTLDWQSISVETGKIPCWQIRLILVQVSVVYFWTNWTKLAGDIDPISKNRRWGWEWITGDVLQTIPSPYFKSFVEKTASTLQVPVASLWGLQAVITSLLEAFLCLGIHMDSLRPVVPLVGVALHTLMGVSGISIGLFSVYMVELYLLVLPPSLEQILSRVVLSFSSFSAYLAQRSGEVTFMASLIIGGLMLRYLIPLDIIFPSVVSTSIIASTFFFFSSKHKGLWGPAYFLGCLIMISLHMSTDELRGFYLPLAHDALRVKDLNRTVYYYDKILSFDPNWAEGAVDLATILEESDPERARLLNEKVISNIDPFSLKGHCGMARYWDKTQNKKNACVFAQKIEDLCAIASKELCHNSDCYHRVRYATQYASQLAKQMRKKWC